MGDNAARGVRLVVAIVGRRNVGKSSLLNLVIGEDTAIVSDLPGTTTDPVAKPYELLPLGPVTFYDTAGLDDEGELGPLRVRATRRVLMRADLAVVVAGEEGLAGFERGLLSELRSLGIPALVVFNKIDLGPVSGDDLAHCRAESIPWETASALRRDGADRVRRAMIGAAPPELRQEPVLVGDLIGEGDLVLCVVPIDLAAPRGRLIAPQVQVIREVLDRDAMALAVKEREIEAALSCSRTPALVVTDSQVVLKVAGDVPDSVPLTTFSILFARQKGDLATLVRGAGAIDTLRDGDRVLVAEACSHHVQADDIGRVKIPRWLTQYTGKELCFEVYSGHDFPENLERYALVVHCGGCMLNRTEMVRRMRECGRRGVPMTNYGVAIAKSQGVLERVTRPLLPGGR
jgi:[FeFe] hydrogenase H-cluster maturation GTPase HydF